MSRYESWSLAELRGAVAAAHDQLSWIGAIHNGFAQSSHHLASLGDSIGLSRNAVAANWGGVAGAAAAQSATSLQEFSRSAHEASLQSATATRELGHATRNHSSRMHEIKTVDTSFHKSLAASGGNPAAATADHHKRVEAAEANRRAAVHQAQALDAKGHEYNTMMKNTRWPTMRSSGSTTTPPPTRYPTLPNQPNPTVPPPPVTRTPTPAPTRTVTAPPVVRPKHGDSSTGNGSTVSAGIGAVGGGGAAASGGSGLGSFGGSGGSGGGSGSGLAGGLSGALLGGGDLAGAPGGPRASMGSAGGAEEARGGLRGSTAAAEEGRGGVYGPGGGGARRNGDDEEKRRPDYLEEDDDPWGLGIADAVPPVIGEEDE